jgi:hypothetical protein
MATRETAARGTGLPRLKRLAERNQMPQKKTTRPAEISVGYAYKPGTGYVIEARIGPRVLPVVFKNRYLPEHYALILDCDRSSVATTAREARETISEAVATMRSLHWRVSDIGDMTNPENLAAQVCLLEDSGSWEL